MYVLHIMNARFVGYLILIYFKMGLFKSIGNCSHPRAILRAGVM